MEDEHRQPSYAYCWCIPADIGGFDEGVGALRFVGITNAIGNVTLHRYVIVTSNHTRSDCYCEHLRNLGYDPSGGSRETICWIGYVLVSDHRQRVSTDVVSCASC